MEINKTKQAVSVSKVEEDQRVDVTKAKPIGQSQTPDSFQIGSSRASSNQSSGSASAEPEKKAGQITGGILIKQMTAARLGESGIKSPESTKSKEQTGTRDLNQKEQRIAEERAPVSDKPPEQSGGTTGDARTRIDNLHDAVMQAATDIYGAPRDGAGNASSDSGSSGGGAGSVGGGPDRATAEQRAKFEEMTGGGTQGPQSGASKLAEMEAKMPGKGMNRLSERTDTAQALLDSVGVQDTSSGSGPDKGIISQGSGGVGYGAGYDSSEGVSGGSKQGAQAMPGLSRGVQRVYIEGGSAVRAEALQADITRVVGKDGTVVEKNSEAQTTTIIYPDGRTIKKYSDNTVVETSADGKTTTTTSPKLDTEEEHAKQQAEKLKQLKDKALGKYNLDEIPKAPKIQGDKDPTEDAVANDTAGTELSFVAQQGAYGLLGQPSEDRQVGGSGNRSTGGNIDYENQAGWGGREIEEDPSDVDVTPGANEELPPAANQPTEEESKSSKRLITSPIAAKKSEDLSRIKLEK